MMAGLTYPNLLWQHKYGKKWLDYSVDENYLFNRAFHKGQRTLTLPSTDPTKKLNINLEKMSQKNIISGFKRQVRCLVLNNDSFFSWSWRDEEGNFISYTAFITLFLEVAYEKKLKLTSLYAIDGDYVFDLYKFVQTKNGTAIHSISREMVGCVHLDEYFIGRLKVWRMESQYYIRKKAEEKQQSLNNNLDDLPSSSKSSGLPIPGFELGSNNEHFKSLNAIAESSTCVSPSSVSVDPNCPIVDQCHVYYEGADVYCVTLNCTNLQDNNNKFYNMQLLEYDNCSNYALWLHWGRVGYKGQNNLIKFKTLDDAKAEFEKKFYDKTKNHFADRMNFQRKRLKYDLIYTDISSQARSQIVTAETKLESKIQDLLNMICNKKNLEEAAQEFSYDSKATPIGKITAKQVLAGYTALSEIVAILQANGTGKDLVEACNVFYTKIPHNFGRKVPPLICNLEDVKDKLRMLELLSNICLAMEVMKENDSLENPIDIYYKNLECSLFPVECNSAEFKALDECIQSTHGPSHFFEIEIIDAFKCVKNYEDTNFIDKGNKKLLWHGSRTSNWLGILKKGLQIAPPEAPATGYMFGKGLYFADVCTKSANYCYATKFKNEGLLVLCEVSLGFCREVYEAKDHSSTKNTCLSVHGVGRLIPDFKKTVLSSEALLPYGPVIHRKTDKILPLNYNEYVVYNIHQVKMKYLLKVRFNFLKS